MAQGKPKEKRRIVVLLVHDSDDPNIRSYSEAEGSDGALAVRQPDEGHATSVDAIKWIKKHGEFLKKSMGEGGRKLVIASMTKPKELKEKQRVATNFDLA